MSLLRRPATTAVAAVATAAVLAGPLAVLTASSASAAERESRCDGAETTFEVEREDGRFQVDADVDDAAPGSRWRVVLRHDGKVFLDTTRRADSDGEVSIERHRPDTRGADAFRMTVNRVGTDGSCSQTIRFRR